MKKLFLSALAVVCAMSLTSCDDFLDSENYTESTTGNYPGSVNDLNKLLSSLYGVLNQYGTYVLETPWMVWHIMSDEALGAGGDTDPECSAIAHFTSNKEQLFDNMWHSTYIGIARANSIISSIDACDWSGNESARNQMLGEAYFFRGLFYLWGSQLWGDIPAYWEAAAPNPCPQQSAEDVIYPHILSDFVSAMNLMSNNASSRAEGHATKISAQGFLARAYLFYEGFYKQVGELAKETPAAVQLYEQEGCSGTLSKQDVIDALNDAINSGAAGLVSDFRQLWQYTNEYTAEHYAYVKDLYDKGEYWAGDGNIEQIFEVKFANAGSWNGNIGIGFANETSLYVSLRINPGADSRANDKFTREIYPFAAGWGQGVFTSYLWEDWESAEPNDLRRKATILDANEGGELTEYAESNPYVQSGAIEAAYTSLALSTEDSEETGYYDKKWMAFTAHWNNFDDPNTEVTTDSSPYTWWGVARSSLGGGTNEMSSFQGDHFSDMVLMRYADILLMKDELAGTADGMNQLRERAGLGSVSYSLANIKAERRWEFAGEGIRFNDMRRWSGKNPSTGCEAAVALQRQEGSTVYFDGVKRSLYCLGGSWAQRYADTKGGFLKIPSAQITAVADESVLTQNDGWKNGAGSSSGMFSY